MAGTARWPCGSRLPSTCRHPVLPPVGTRSWSSPPRPSWRSRWGPPRCWWAARSPASPTESRCRPCCAAAGAERRELPAQLVVDTSVDHDEDHLAVAAAAVVDFASLPLALALGTPCVTTPSAAAALHLTDGRDVLVEDDLPAARRRAAELAADDVTASRLSPRRVAHRPRPLAAAGRPHPRAPSSASSPRPTTSGTARSAGSRTWACRRAARSANACSTPSRRSSPRPRPPSRPEGGTDVRNRPCPQPRAPARGPRPPCGRGHARPRGRACRGAPGRRGHRPAPRSSTPCAPSWSEPGPS